MRLATIRDGSRDGALVVVRADGTRFAPAPATFPNLQAALDRWAEAQPALLELAARLDSGGLPGTAVEAGTSWGPPLPRAYEWLDGSAFLHHVRLARRSRGAEIPPELETDPLMYQGARVCCSGRPIPCPSAIRRWAWTSRRRLPSSWATSPAESTLSRRGTTSDWSAC
jgi:fumarylacetoacetate (FAA) hydrolase